MAFGIRGGSGQVQGNLVHAVSVRGAWTQINDDLETADTANLLKPWNISRSTFGWLIVPDWATRVLVRAKIDLASTTYTTSPVVRMVGAFPTNADIATARNKILATPGFSGTAGDANAAEFLRLDAPAANATGVTLSVTAAKTTMFIDTAGYIYCDPPDLTGYDLKGSGYLGMMVETAAAVTGGAANGVFGEVLFL